MPFACSICEELSTHICVSCTKDACANHLCLRCNRCSDCCECEEPLAESTPVETVAQAAIRNAPFVATAPAHAPAPPQRVESIPQPEPEPDSPEPESAFVDGADALAAPESAVEPAGIPPEDVAGETSDKDLP